ncbi:MAG: hypothetical protein M1833_004200 [Piccolia ochrophora]|nr:MAG: hypothetical protein M1833_004200 [Piccolia ochrophora]
MASASYHSSMASTPLKPDQGKGNFSESTSYGYDQVPSQYTEDHLERLQTSDEKLKRTIRILRILSRCATAVLSAVIVGLMAVTVSRYLSTRNEIAGGRGPWADNTQLWPTIMLFTIAGISLVLNLFILVAYCFSIRAANRTAIVSSVFTGGIFVIGLVVWIVVAALYKYGKDHKTDGVHRDLWGWACGSGAQRIQGDFKEVVNFQSLCTLQGRSWHTSIAEIVVEAFTLSIYVVVYLRLKQKRKLQQARQSIPVQAL